MDNISAGFLKGDADILSIPVTQICNLSVKPSYFPNNSKLAKLKPIKKPLKQILKVFGQSPIYLKNYTESNTR